MLKVKFLLVIVLGFIFLTGCVNSPINYEIEEIEKIVYKSSPGTTATIEEIHKEEEDAIEDIYKELKKIRYSKKRPRIDLWGNEIIYKAPNGYAILEVFIEDYGINYYYFYEENVYYDFKAYNYSTSGYNAISIARRYIDQRTIL